MTPIGRFRVRWLGRLPYSEAWDLQGAIWEGRVAGQTEDDYLLLLEHPPVFTVGRNGTGANLLVGRDELARRRIALHDVDRGGDVTYHGPGQVVGYPVMAVPPRPDGGYDAVGHVRRIEAGLIAGLAELGVTAWAEPGLTGVWTDAGKVAAIGVRVSRGVATHGFALNVDPDFEHWGLINPCGITDRPVTALSRLLPRAPAMEDVVQVLIPHLHRALAPDRDAEVQLAAFARGSGRPFDIDAMVAAGVFSPERRDEIPITIGGRLAGEPERPDWMRVTARPGTEGFRDTKRLMAELGLNTVCEEAKCPNIYECWGHGTATLMLLGDRCTRACGFCDVTTGRPGAVDWTEPDRAAAAIEAMALEHAVLTSVNRDDLSDGGAGVFAATIRSIRRRRPGCSVEVLIPDFKGDPAALETVMRERPEVLNHNLETVLRLQRDIRTAANYGRSLALLARARRSAPAGRVKSGLIVGMGERPEEVLGTLADLRAVGVDIVTIGQYLRPTARHRPVDRFAPPEEFAAYRAEGLRLGIPHVESGPLVRSSYHARDSLAAATA